MTYRSENDSDSATVRRSNNGIVDECRGVLREMEQHADSIEQELRIMRRRIRDYLESPPFSGPE